MPKKTSKKSSKKTKVTKPAKKTVKTKKVDKPVAPPQTANPPVPQVLPPVAVKTEAEKIWDEIKNRPIEMFGLPDQYVFQHATFVPVEPNTLYVTIRSTATLPSLEAAIAPHFTVELADKFVLIKRVSKPLIPFKKR